MPKKINQKRVKPSSSRKGTVNKKVSKNLNIIYVLIGLGVIFLAVSFLTSQSSHPSQFDIRSRSQVIDPTLPTGPIVVPSGVCLGGVCPTDEVSPSPDDEEDDDSGNRGPGNGDDDGCDAEDSEDDDNSNSGPGNGNDDEEEDDDDISPSPVEQNSIQHDDSGNSGPGNGDDDGCDAEDSEDDDNSGPGNGNDDDDISPSPADPDSSEEESPNPSGNNPFIALLEQLLAQLRDLMGGNR